MARNQKDSHSSRPNPDRDNAYAKFSGLAIEVASFNLLCIWGGYKLSQLYSPKSHWILILSVFLGMAGTIWYLFKRLINKD
ncbi:MAG: AtpZ/AtpI family protein [Cyclobacteriaceae bacterium]|nr:AtpZ/AtpI family protein [Cyclobacteriaceae bacterium SS2]